MPEDFMPEDFMPDADAGGREPQLLQALVDPRATDERDATIGDGGHGVAVSLAALLAVVVFLALAWAMLGG